MDSAWLEIKNNTLRLVIDPIGAKIVHFGLRTGGNILQSCLHKKTYTPDECGGFPLLPMGNRVRGNSYQLQSASGRMQTIKLNCTSPDGSEYLHGTGWNSEWLCKTYSVFAENEEKSLTFKMSNTHGEVGKGYNFETTLIFSLTTTALTIALTLKHTGSASRLYGLGFHPYFEFDPQQDQVCAAVSAYAPETDGHFSGEFTPNMGKWDISHPTLLPDEFVNHIYSGFNGVELYRPNFPWPNKKIRMTSSAPYLMMYRPKGSNFLALEPQTHVVDAANRADKGGLVKLSKNFRKVTALWRIELC